MNTQLSVPAIFPGSQSAADSAEMPDSLGKSAEQTKIIDTNGWTVVETLKMVGELRAKCLRNLQLAERGEFRDQRTISPPVFVRQESSVAGNSGINMTSIPTSMELNAAGEEMATLQKELVEARVRAELAAERLDRAEHRLEGASTLIGCMRARIQELELETDRLEWQCDKSEKSIRQLEKSILELEKSLGEMEMSRRAAVELNVSLNDKLRKAFTRIGELESSWWHKFKSWFLTCQNIQARV